MTIESVIQHLFERVTTLERGTQEVSRTVVKSGMYTHKNRSATLSSDTFDAVHDYYALTPETGNTDDLSTIDGGEEGRKIAIRTADPAYTITVKDGVDNIDLCGNDIDLDCVEKVLVLIYDTTLGAWIRYGLDGPASAGTFLGLSDTPGSYASQSLKIARVNAGETAIEFVSPSAASPVINFGALETLTISGGSVARTLTTSFFNIAAETGTADELDTITGGSDGDMIVLRPDTGDTITVKDNTGNIQLNSDFAMDDPSDKITLIYDSAISKWCEASDRSSNA